MSDTTKSNTTTPAKEAPKANDATPGKEEKSLNVNAKSFVPKGDSTTSVAEGAKSPASGGSRSAGSPGRSGSAATAPMAGGAMPMPGMPGFPPVAFMPGMPGMPMAGPMPGMMGFPPGAMPGKGVPPMMGMPPPLGMVPPSPLSGSNRPMAPGATFVPSSPLMGGAPTTPLTPAVSVGNATLQAKRSKAPPKFGCVLLAGVTGVGKTTIGNSIVQELSSDDIPWKFFCGADHLKDAPSAKPAAWDTTRSVFDGLGEYLDALLAKQTSEPIRGLLIDKQLRGVEDLYYLTSLLRSKGLLLWGVLGMDCADDEVLASRLGNTPGLNEKIKFHRVIYSRIQEASKSVGLWRTVDASGSKQDTQKHLRTMVLGCSSQSPTKQFNPALYHDSPVPLVDNYANYAGVMSNLFSVIPRNAKGVAMFPGTTTFNPMSASMLDAKKNPLKDYAVRRKVDGTKYVLFYDGAKLYLIPRHMRCVFEMSQDAWLGVHLSNTGKFVVDGELAKISKDRSKEKFVVSDVVYWAEKGTTTNLVARASWKERQERLKTNLCSEVTAFFPKKGDIVVVHQSTVDEPRLLAHLLEPTDYPSDGLVFHSTTRRDEAPIMWRPPEAITVDFRLGTGTKNEEDKTWTFVAEVFDTGMVKYNQYRTDTITITGGYRPTIIEGAIVCCNLDNSSGTPKWNFQRVRNDLIAASLKTQVDELLRNCLVPRQSVLDFVAALEARYAKEQGGASKSGASTTTAAGGATAATTGDAKQPQLGTASQPPAAQPNGKSLGGGRGAFGSALAGPGGAPPEGATPSMRDVLTGEHKKSTPNGKDSAPNKAGNKDEAMMTDAEKLSSVVGSVSVKTSAPPGGDVATLASMVGNVSVVGTNDNKAEPPKKRAPPKQVLLSNVPKKVNKDDLYYYCEPFGELADAEFLKDEEGANAAIVTFKHAEDAAALKNYKKFTMYHEAVSAKFYDPEAAAKAQAKSFLVLKVRDVTKEEVMDGIPETLRSTIVSLRNTSNTNSRVFLDLTDANALDILKDPSLRIAGKSFSVENQRRTKN